MRGPSARACRGVGVLAAASWVALAIPTPVPAQDAAALRNRHAELREALAVNPFNRPLHLASHEDGGRASGDIHAEIDTPLSVAGPALRKPDHWCDILMLHLNVKGCEGATGADGRRLIVHVGRKFDQPLADAHRVEFQFGPAVVHPGYQQVVLGAERGPMGTSHYRLLLEVVALDERRSFVHLSYSYATGLSARLALQAYLATLGRDKVGFSIVGHDRQGRPVPVRGTRGMIERNTMRYYLAVEAYLGALRAPPEERAEKRLNDWFTGIERHPVQLHEMERRQYLEMKRREIRRQQAHGVAAVP